MDCQTSVNHIYTPTSLAGHTNKYVQVQAGQFFFQKYELSAFTRQVWSGLLLRDQMITFNLNQVLSGLGRGPNQ